MISITKKFEFEAAHMLPNHKGKCKNLHGHRYELEVTVRGPINSEGMVMDFSDLKEMVNELVIDRFDHSCLNDKITFIPTAENLVEYIRASLARQIERAGRKLEKIRLYETADSYAEWRAK